MKQPESLLNRQAAKAVAANPPVFKQDFDPPLTESLLRDLNLLDMSKPQ